MPEHCKVVADATTLWVRGHLPGPSASPIRTPLSRFRRHARRGADPRPLLLRHGDRSPVRPGHDRALAGPRRARGGADRWLSHGRLYRPTSALVGAHGANGLPVPIGRPTSSSASQASAMVSMASVSSTSTGARSSACARGEQPATDQPDSARPQHLVHPFGGLPSECRDDVTVCVEGEADLAVAQSLHHHPGRDSLAEQE